MASPANRLLLRKSKSTKVRRAKRANACPLSPSPGEGASREVSPECPPEAPPDDPIEGTAGDKNQAILHHLNYKKQTSLAANKETK